MSGPKNYGTFIQWNTMQQKERRRDNSDRITIKNDKKSIFRKAVK